MNLGKDITLQINGQDAWTFNTLSGLSVIDSDISLESKPFTVNFKDIYDNQLTQLDVDGVSESYDVKLGRDVVLSINGNQVWRFNTLGEGPYDSDDA